MKVKYTTRDMGDGSKIHEVVLASDAHNQGAFENIAKFLCNNEDDARSVISILCCKTMNVKEG